MDLTATGSVPERSIAVDVDELRAAVATATTVSTVGGRTHWEVGGAPPEHAVEVSAPGGVTKYDPADLTVVVNAGTTCAELGAVLAAAGQECPLDPRSGRATVGGALAVGLSGHRRLRYGPLRDYVLEVRFVTADGRLVTGGGPTVKNVTGYDLPRLLVGSLGTIGVMVRVILRCQPLAAVAEWTVTDGDPFDVRRRTFRPSCIVWDGHRTHVLLEGVPADVAGERAAIRSEPSPAPVWPDGPHRGRLSVRPGLLPALAPALDGTGVHWLAEVGVGTVHVASDSDTGLARARAIAEGAGGWMLREHGAPALDGFGSARPNPGMTERVRAAFDPTGKLSPGRLGPVRG